MNLTKKIDSTLVIWFGIYQAFHIAVNGRALFELSAGHISFPAVPPAGGWSPQLLPFFEAMAALDLINAVLTLVFVYGFLRKRTWSFWLGTVTLTVAHYAALLFNYGTIAAGAWQENVGAYLFINITFLPVVILFIRYCRRAFQRLPAERS